MAEQPRVASRAEQPRKDARRTSEGRAVAPVALPVGAARGGPVVLVVLANLDEEGRHRRRAPARELAGLPGRVGVGAGRVRLTARVMAMIAPMALHNPLHNP